MLLANQSWRKQYGTVFIGMTEGGGEIGSVLSLKDRLLKAPMIEKLLVQEAVDALKDVEHLCHGVDHEVFEHLRENLELLIKHPYSPHGRIPD